MSHLLTFTCNIGPQQTRISEAQIAYAIGQQTEGSTHQLIRHDIHLAHFPEAAHPVHWEDLAFQVTTSIKQFLQQAEIEHLHVFAIGPMPLLMQVGYALGDKIPMSLYQAHRKVQNPEQNWAWQEDFTNLPFRIQTMQEAPESQEAGLLISISDSLSPNRYQNCLSPSAAWYELSIPNPSPHCLKHPDQVQDFARAIRELLNDLQATHPPGTCIHLFPAIPIALAIQLGRILMPTKDLPLWTYEFDAGQQQFRRVLQLN